MVKYYFFSLLWSRRQFASERASFNVVYKGTMVSFLKELAEQPEYYSILSYIELTGEEYEELSKDECYYEIF